MSDKVHQKQIWLVRKDFTANKGISSDTRKVVVEAHEVIYIQNPYAWHFRTLDGGYLVAPEETILEHCDLLGEVFDNVSFQASMPPLAFVMEYHLYTEADRSLNIEMRTSKEYKKLLARTYKMACDKEIKYIEKRQES